METKHTATPWVQEDCEIINPLAVLSTSVVIATCGKLNDAEFIVRACNAHDDLVRACQFALECATVPIPFLEQKAKAEKCIEMLRAALAKADKQAS